MRILLVTWVDKLSEKFATLNPELEYCAIVTDDVEAAKEVLGKFSLSQDLLHPMDELRKCIESLDYDYLLCVQDKYSDEKIGILQKCAVPSKKVISFNQLTTKSSFNFDTEKALRYYQEHSQEFEMFATGISTAFEGLDVTQFKHKLFNFAKPSQDLYYDYKVAKYVVSCGKGNSKIRYALIGLAPYSFHYDLSQVFRYRFLFLPYVIAFNDLHNFFMTVDVYRKFLREEWLAKKFPLKPFNANRPYGGGHQNKAMDSEAINTATNTWAGKYYPKTRDENVKILDNYLTFCEENNIRPIMFRVIVSEKYIANFNKKLLEEFDSLVEQACRKHPTARFFDGWKLDDFTYADFFDHGHLNSKGAAKFSAYFNKFIEQLEKKGS